MIEIARRISRGFVRFALALLFLVCTAECVAQSGGGADALARQASWQIADDGAIERAIKGWLDETEATEDQRNAVLEKLRASLIAGREPLDVVLDAIEVIRDDLTPLRNSTLYQRNALRIPDFAAVLNEPHENVLVHDHMLLLYGKWLAQNELFDESLEQLNQLDTSRVLDPATLLFYRGLVEHQLLMKDECTATIEKLLENADALPKRFRIVGQLVLADIEPLEEGSLDEISRLMSDIRRRQSLYRSGQRVRDQEQEVIDKLDRMIEDLEAQQQQQQQQSASNQSSSPMDDSQNAAGQGDGQVTGTTQIEGGEWGNLPPEQRAAALAEMSKDLPPHYRPVIEEYFRQMAGDRDK